METMKKKFGWLFGDRVTNWAATISLALVALVLGTIAAGCSDDKPAGPLVFGREENNERQAQEDRKAAVETRLKENESAIEMAYGGRDCRAIQGTRLKVENPVSYQDPEFHETELTWSDTMPDTVGRRKVVAHRRFSEYEERSEALGCGECGKVVEIELTDTKIRTFKGAVVEEDERVCWRFINTAGLESVTVAFDGPDKDVPSILLMNHDTAGMMPGTVSYKSDEDGRVYDYSVSVGQLGDVVTIPIFVTRVWVGDGEAGHSSEEWVPVEFTMTVTPHRYSEEVTVKAEPKADAAAAPAKK